MLSVIDAHHHDPSGYQRDRSGTVFYDSFSVGERLCANAIQSQMRQVATCVLRDQQYMFCVKSLLMVTKVLLMRNDLVAVLFQRPMQVVAFVPEPGRK